MADIEILTETEQPNHWAYQVRVFSQGRTHDHHVTLNWSDYDLWCKGRIPPEKVVKAAFAFLLDREEARQILSRFDCSVIRRYFPQVDQQINRYFP